MIFTILAYVIIFVFYGVKIVSRWLILTKANEQGWKCLIPVYEDYMFFKIAGATKYFWRKLVSFCVAMLLLNPVLEWEPGSAGFSASFGYNEMLGEMLIMNVIGAIYTAACIYFVYCRIKHAILLARSFGKGGWFASGIFLLEIVFYPIMAFSSNIRYQGLGASQPKAAPVVTPAPAPAPQTSQIPLPNTAPIPPRNAARLLGRGGCVAGQTHTITANSVIGRSSAADIRLNDGSVSGRHCQIGWRNGKLFLTDLGSSNGTFVDGYGKIPANVPVELRSNDIIRIGRDNTFEVKI